MTKKEFEALLADFRYEMYSVGHDNGDADAKEYSFYSADTSRADALEKQIIDAFATQAKQLEEAERAHERGFDGFDTSGSDEMGR